MTAFKYASCFVGIAVALVTATAVKADTPKPTHGIGTALLIKNGKRVPLPPLPQGPCDADHVLDWELIDGVLYECACDHMMFGPPVCEWQEITSQAEDPVRLRKTVKRIKAKHWHLVVVKLVAA